MLLFKRSKKGAIGPLLVILLLSGYVISAMDSNTIYRQKAEKVSKGHLCEISATSLPYLIKEEVLPPAAPMTPVFLKAILPPAVLSAKTDKERQYKKTTLRLLPIVWNPTIPIAMRKLTV
ncbi:MAG TPA: hypothetical protein VF473_02305 [Cyclobacteriaceae bacterium]